MTRPYVARPQAPPAVVLALELELRNMKHRQCALDAGIVPSYLSGILSGRVHASDEVKQRIADNLDSTIEYLFAPDARIVAVHS